MRSELDVQAIPGKKYLQTTEISTFLLIYCDSFKTQRNAYYRASREKQ